MVYVACDLARGLLSKQTMKVLTILAAILSQFWSISGCADEADQSAVCSHFLTCVEALDIQRGVTSNVERYTFEGECWGSDVGAAICNTSCERGLVFIHERFQGAPQECAP